MDNGNVLRFDQSSWAQGVYNVELRFNGFSHAPLRFEISRAVRALDFRLVRLDGGTLNELEEGTPMVLGLQFFERGAGGGASADGANVEYDAS